MAPKSEPPQQRLKSGTISNQSSAKAWPGPSQSHATQEATGSQDLLLPKLQSVSETLHLLYHRNKNQHRLAHWWRWVGMLRREMLRLSDLVEVAEDVVKGLWGTDVEASSSLREGKEWDPVEERMEWISRAIVPGCWDAFSQVVKDIRFYTLGVLLMTVVAEVASVVGLPATAFVVEEIIGDNAKAHTSIPASISVALELGIVAETEDEDLGEIVSRYKAKSQDLASETTGQNTFTSAIVPQKRVVDRESSTKDGLEFSDVKLSEATKTPKKKKKEKHTDLQTFPGIARSIDGLQDATFLREEPRKVKRNEGEDKKKKKKKKKSKSKGDAIDDLFSVLL